MIKKVLGFTLGAGVGLLALYLLRRYSAKQKAVTPTKPATPTKSESVTMQIANPQSTARFTVRNSGPKPHGPNIIDEVNAAMGVENKITLTARKPVVASESTTDHAEVLEAKNEETPEISLEGKDDFEVVGRIFGHAFHEVGHKLFMKFQQYLVRFAVKYLSLRPPLTKCCCLVVFVPHGDNAGQASLDKGPEPGRKITRLFKACPVLAGEQRGKLLETYKLCSFFLRVQADGCNMVFQQLILCGRKS